MKTVITPHPPTPSPRLRGEGEARDQARSRGEGGGREVVDQDYVRDRVVSTVRMLSSFKIAASLALVFTCFTFVVGAENELTPEEKAAGWVLLFDGRSTVGWLDSKEWPVAASHVQDGALNPHPCNYMLIHKDIYGDFKLSLNFKISPKCNSGVFIRTFPLKPREGKDVGFNGIEVAIDDTTTNGFHDTGALYDLVSPSKNAMNPTGEWNHLLVTCYKGLITVEINGTEVTRTDLDQWTAVNKRPDGTDHKFDVAYKGHPRAGYIGLQDHGSDVWFRNVKLLKLK